VDLGDGARKTTLTIVQDFPKKKVDAPPVNNEMVQHKSKDVKLEDDNRKTTLTIV